MTLVRSNALNYGFNEKLTSAEMNVVDSQLPYAVDGNAGGTYAPSGLISIGGTGLRVTTALSVTGAGSVNFYSGAFSADAASITLSGVPVLFDAISTVTFDSGFTASAGTTASILGNLGVGTTSADALSVAATSTFASKANFNGDTEFNGQNQIDDITVFSITSDTTFSGAMLFENTAAMTFSAASTITGSTVANLSLVGGSAISFDATGTFAMAAGSIFNLEGVLIPAGAGHVRKRNKILVDAASVTFGINDGDTIVSPSLAATRSWTLTSTGAVEGDHIFISAWAVTGGVNLLNVVDDGAFTIIQLQNTSGWPPWVYLHFRTGAWRVLAYAILP